MKRIIPGMLLLIAVAVVAYVLWSNRKQMEASALLAEASVQRIPVTTYRIVPVEMTEVNRVSGRLEAENELMLTAPVQGRIARVSVKKGQPVRRGQVIATIDDELYREQYEVSRSAYQKLRKDLERFEIMAENEAITRQQLEGARLNLEQAEAKYLAAEKQLDETRIKSPIDGVINQLFVKEGGMLGPGVPVCEIVNAGQMKLNLRVTENLAGSLEAGQVVPVTIGLSGADSVSGVISFVSVKPDYASLYTVDISLPEMEASATAGKFATAYFTKRTKDSVTYVPAEAVLGLGGETLHVFRVQDSLARKVTVRSFDNVGNMTGLRGVSFNDEIIVTGNTIVRDGQLIIRK